MGVTSCATLPFLPGTHVFSTVFKLLQANSTLFKHLWLVTMRDYSQGHIRIRFFYLHKSLEELKIAIGTVEPVKRGMAFFTFSGFKLC